MGSENKIKMKKKIKKAFIQEKQRKQIKVWGRGVKVITQ